MMRAAYSSDEAGYSLLNSLGHHAHDDPQSHHIDEFSISF